VSRASGITGASRTCPRSPTPASSPAENDLAHLARPCVPIEDDFDQARLGWRPADGPIRLRLVADAYGLDRDGRAGLFNAMGDAIDRVEAAVRRTVDAGVPNAVEMWTRTGGSERYARGRRWWSDHHDRFAAALL
jgi:hypothetical protein